MPYQITTYKDYNLAKDQFAMFTIHDFDGGDVPTQLSGASTTMQTATNAIDTYLTKQHTHD